MRFSVPSEGEGAVVLEPKCMLSSVSLLTELQTQPPFRGRTRNPGIGIFNPEIPGLEITSQKL